MVLSSCFIFLVQDLEARMTVVESNVTDNSARIDTAEFSIATLNNKVGDNTARITTTESYVANLNKTLTENTARITYAESSITDVDSKISINTARINGAESSIAILNNEASEHSGQISVLNNKATNTGVSLEQLCHRIDYLYHSQDPRYDCCANPNNNLVVCVNNSFASIVGITPGSETDGCLKTDTACQ